MKVKDLREKTEKELQTLVLHERENLRKMFFQISAGRLKDVSRVNKSKRILARILTILKEKHA